MIPERGVARGMFSRVLHLYFRMTRGLTLGVRAVVLSDDGKVLLVRHSYTPGWHFPGGGVEKDETVRQALVKEVLQETGLRLVGQSDLHGVFFNRGTSMRDHIVVFRCLAEGNLPDKPASLEITEAGFFHLGDLPADIDPGTGRRLMEIDKGVPLSDDW